MAVPNIPGWQAIILRKVGAPATAENIRFLNAWSQAEGGSAQNNPFNTTEPGHGTTGDYNSVGVKRYDSANDGIQATVDTLLNGRYGAILGALKNGNSAMADAEAEATTPWGTGSLIEKVLGGKVTGGQPTAGSGAVDAANSSIASIAGGTPTRQQLAQLIFGGGNQTNFGSNQIDVPNLMAIAQSIKGGTTTLPNAGGAPAGPTGPVGTGAITNGTIPGGFYEGDIQGIQPGFLSKLTGASRAAGVTKIKVISGYRSPADNAAVGGAKDSNHMTGNAMDASGYIPGKGWQPLGAILLPVAGKYGLRSGDTPGFFNGSTDPNHVDDDANQGR